MGTKRAYSERDAATKRAYYAENREAILATTKAYREANRELLSAKSKAYQAGHKAEVAATSRRRYYGLSEAEYAELLSRWGGRCHICLAEYGDRSGRALNVDHNHTTGVVRGLLCGACNLGVGKFKDLPAVLRRAADYLEDTNGI